MIGAGGGGGYGEVSLLSLVDQACYDWLHTSCTAPPGWHQRNLYTDNTAVISNLGVGQSELHKVLYGILKTHK